VTNDPKNHLPAGSYVETQWQRNARRAAQARRDELAAGQHTDQTQQQEENEMTHERNRNWPAPYVAGPGQPDPAQPRVLAEESYSVPEYPGGQPPRRLSRGLIVVGVIGVLILVATAVGMFLASRDSIPGVKAAPAPFEQAVTDCSALGMPGVRVTDGGKTLIVDGRGDEDSSGTSIITVVCLLGNLKTPEAVKAHMDSTRALDGRQEDSWPGYTAAWSYHPDTGIDLVIRAV
jgi:hypothetical protein